MLVGPLRKTLVPALALSLGIVAFPSCKPQSTEPPPLTRKELNQEIEPLYRELRTAREEIQRLAKQPIEGPPVSSAIPRTKEPASTEDLQQITHSLRRELFDLTLALNRLKTPTPAEPKAQRLSGVTKQNDEVLSLVLPPHSENQFVAIENTGRSLLINPRIQINGQPDWFDTAAILSAAYPPGTPDREKALALWKIVIAAREHGAPAHPTGELHDPVKLFNCYGYGFCDDAASALMQLARAAGLPARIWDLEGHVVPELYFDGQWNLLDPDGEVCYFLEDGTFANVEILQREPERIRKYPSRIYADAEALIRIYGSAADNRVSDFYERTSQSGHRMGFTLRPGESLLRSSRNWGRYFSSAFYAEPPRYGNGRLNFHPIFADGLFQLGAESSQGLTAVQTGDRWILQTNSEKPAELIYRFKLPYPMLTGRLDATFELPESGKWEATVSEDGQAWIPLRSSEPEQAPGHFTSTHFSVFRNGYGDPVYEYLLKIQLQGTAKTPAKLLQIDCQTEFQVAPKSVPALAEGTNSIHFLSDGGSVPTAKLEFGYSTK